MFIIETYQLAVLCSIITMICWGSWPNTQKLVDKSWRFELFYWDYVIGILLVAALMAVTLGTQGNEGRNFWSDVKQASGSSFLSACIGGAIFNAGNILFIAALTFSGMAVAFPVGVGLSMVIGVVINYIAMPVGNPGYLFAGVAFVIAAILFSTLASRSHSKGKGQSKASGRGIWLAIGAAILFGLFYRFVAASMVTDFNNPEPGRLTPYTAVLFFGIGVVISNIFLNTFLMYKPFEGSSVSYRDYFRGRFKNHIFGILGGVIWGLGISLSILSAGKVGFAISFGLGQGNAMIAAIWGVFVWKEFKNANPRTTRSIWLMFACYIIGLLLIILSRIN